MRINNIKKYDLETRAKTLKGEGKTLEEISQILTEEAKTTISTSTVYRYFESNEKAIVQAIEKSDKLKEKLADAEINTITKRVEIIDYFLEITEEAQACGDFKAAIMALRGATEAQDSLDERLGKLKGPATNVNILNIQEATHGAREALRSRINGIAANFSEIGNSEFYN
jgi:AcrR family transcriptional regulator